VLVRKSDRKSLHRRPKHRWRVIKMYLKEMEWEGVEWMHLAYDRNQWWALANAGISLLVPNLTNLATTTFSRTFLQKVGYSKIQMSIIICTTPF
jgi:hypothetical protein